MAYTVARPKMTFAEKVYLPAILAGLGITFRHFVKILSGKKKVTMQYPEEKWDQKLPPHYRGAPTLVKDEHGRERCVACQLCEFIVRHGRLRLFQEKSRKETDGGRSKNSRRNSRST